MAATVPGLSLHRVPAEPAPRECEGAQGVPAGTPLTRAPHARGSGLNMTIEVRPDFRCQVIVKVRPQLWTFDIRSHTGKRRRHGCFPVIQDQHGAASRPEPLSSGTQVLGTYIARL
jgi:hypothetical protein